MSFFTKATIGALKDFPYLNAEIQGKELVLKKFYDIGIAVSAADGLVVPVVRDADQLDFAGVEKEIGNLAKKAQETNWAWMISKVVHLRSQMVVLSDPCYPRQSLMRHKFAFWACTISKNVRWLCLMTLSKFVL